MRGDVLSNQGAKEASKSSKRVKVQLVGSKNEGSGEENPEDDEDEVPG